MKKQLFTFLVIGQLLITGKTFSQNIAVNATGDLPDTSAMLDVSSTVKGFLSPRMTTAERNAIPLPAKGLLVYNTSTNTFNVNTGTPLSPSWTEISSGATTNTLGSAGNTITSTVNGVQATTDAVNSVSNSSSANTLSTTVNGVTGSTVPIINTNALSLSGSSITSTVNGLASSALNISGAVTANAWSLLGNSGTNASTNFIGTTNNVDFVVRTNNTERLRVRGGGNVGINTNNPGSTLDVKGTLRLSGATSGYVGFAPAAAAGSTTYTLPTADGSSGQVLSTNGSGTLSWATVSSGGGSGWSLTGNSGTSSSNYIGTSDYQPIIFKVNNTQAGYIGTAGDRNTLWGMGTAATYQATALGYNASANSGNNATAVGYAANARGYRSVAIGSDAQTANQNDGVAIGYNSNANSYMGIAIGANATTSSSNNALAFGVSASASGQNSNAIGNGASATGQNSTALGNGASATAANATAIGNGASATSSNTISIGNTSVTAIRGQVNFTTYSDGRFKINVKENVPGLDFIAKLRPVTYTWDIHKFNAHARGNDYQVIPAAYNPEEEAAIRKKESITYTGFIAQEVDKAAQENNFNFSGVNKPVDDKDAYSLSYAEFVVPLVKAAQELNQKINEQQKMIEALQEEISKLKKKK